jgi:hypothetical protein
MSVKSSRVIAVATTLGMLLACLGSLMCGSALGSVQLPDGRTWEMVSPLNKNGGDIDGIAGDSGGGIVQASASGGAITYLAQGSFGNPAPAGASANQYLSRREPGSWSTQNITTLANAGTYGAAGTGAPYKAFSSDLSLGLLINGEGTGEAAIENPPLPTEPEAPARYQNFYVRDDINGGLKALLTFMPSVPANEFYMYFQGASPDLRHIVVSNNAALTTGATVNEHDRNLYEWTDGKWLAVNVLPMTSGGETALGAQLGSGLGESNMISDDGTRIFWSYGINSTAALYVRKDGTETVRIDARQGGLGVGVNENPFPEFQTASVDGSQAFFTSHSPLTSDANTGPPCGSLCKRGGTDLYRFSVQGGELRDLSVDRAAEQGAEVQGVLGASEDGSYVYFVALGVLTGSNVEGRSPAAGEDNLYVWHEDPVTHLVETSFIRSLSGSDESDWSPEVLRRSTRVASGGQIVFVSDGRLTDYDNVDSHSTARDGEVYLYDPRTRRLSCASCNPSNARPIGSSSIPAGTPFEHLQGGGAIYQSRVLSASGDRVFFESDDALVPQDTNNMRDVYEYESGHVYLISGGTSARSSNFVDASASGNDVFFLTRQQLARGDTDQLVDLYDARVNGGVVEPQSAPICEGSGCRLTVPQAPVFGVGASATFVGTGNLSQVVSRSASRTKAKSKKHKTKGHHKTRRSRVRNSSQAAQVPEPWRGRR